MANFNKVNVTYHAPEGDSKVVEMLKTTFYDNVPIDVICTRADFEMLENNQHFQVNSSVEYDPSEQTPPKKHEEEHKATKR